MIGDVAGHELARVSEQDDPEVLRREIGQLRASIASRAVIEQAKGMLMLRYAVDSDTAFAVLVRWSQADNIKVRIIAEAFVDHMRRADQSRLAGVTQAQGQEDCPTRTPGESTTAPYPDISEETHGRVHR